MKQSFPDNKKPTEESMIDPASTPDAVSEHRYPAAYSQGFAHVRILTVINPDDPGPLVATGSLDVPVVPEFALEGAPRAPLDDLLRAD